MGSNRIQVLIGVLVLGVAMIGGWAATTALQRSVPLVPGIESCWRLEGSSRQVACLSDEFLAGADDAAGASTGVARDRKVISYVRRAEGMANEDARLADTCHPAMHQLGRREGRTASGQDRVPTFPGGSSQLCTAGYVHGLAEGYLGSTSTADVAAVFPQLCHDSKSRTGCAHGIGHALVQAEADTPASTLGNRSLDRCEELPTDFATECFNGVYMELAMRTGPKAMEPSLYVSRCRTAEGVERQLSCWGYLGLELKSNDITLEAVPDWCARASLPGQFPCIDGYGRDLGVERVARCADSSERVSLQHRCIDGAIGLQVGSGHVSARDARTRCGDLPDAELETYCREAVGRYARGRATVEQA